MSKSKKDKWGEASEHRRVGLIFHFHHLPPNNHEHERETEKAPIHLQFHHPFDSKKKKIK